MGDEFGTVIFVLLAVGGVVAFLRHVARGYRSAVLEPSRCGKCGRRGPGRFCSRCGYRKF
jgi:hypothetical protein